MKKSRKECGESVNIPAAGARVLFGQRFNENPTVQVCVLHARIGDSYKLAPDDTGFDIKIFNESQPVSRSINWLAY